MWLFSKRSDIRWWEQKSKRVITNENNTGSFIKRFSSAYENKQIPVSHRGEQQVGMYLSNQGTYCTSNCAGVIESLTKWRSSSYEDPGGPMGDRHGVKALGNGRRCALPTAPPKSRTNRGGVLKSRKKKTNVSYRLPQFDKLKEEKQQPVVVESDESPALKKGRRASEDEIDDQQGGKARELEKKLNELQGEIRVLEDYNSSLEQGNQSLREQTLKDKQAIDNAENILNDLQQQYLELTRCLEKKDELIAALNQDIVQRRNQQPRSGRDDHYFETGLSVLFRSIQNWVLAYYGTMQVPADFSEASIPHRMHDRLSQQLGDEFLTLMQNNAFELLQSYVILELREFIFTPFLFGEVEGSLLSKIKSLAAPEEATKWWISTVKLIVQRNDFQEVISTTAQNLANQIVETLETLAGNTQGTPKVRTRKLKAHIEQAAQLAVEFWKEPAAFSFEDFPPSTPCSESRMSDALGGREDQEMQDSGSRVVITVHPAVVRSAFAADEEVVILKAKVLASPPVSSKEAVVEA